jgi:hypothetical protein
VLIRSYYDQKYLLSFTDKHSVRGGKKIFSLCPDSNSRCVTCKILAHKSLFNPSTKKNYERLKYANCVINNNVTMVVTDKDTKSPRSYVMCRRTHISNKEPIFAFSSNITYVIMLYEKEVNYNRELTYIPESLVDKGVDISITEIPCVESIALPILPSSVFVSQSSNFMSFPCIPASIYVPPLLQPLASMSNFTQPLTSMSNFTQSLASTSNFTQSLASTSNFTQSLASTSNFTQPLASMSNFTQSTTYIFDKYIDERETFTRIGDKNRSPDIEQLYKSHKRRLIEVPQDVLNENIENDPMNYINEWIYQINDNDTDEFDLLHKGSYKRSDSITSYQNRQY